MSSRESGAGPPARPLRVRPPASGCTRWRWDDREAGLRGDHAAGYRQGSGRQRRPALSLLPRQTGNRPRALRRTVGGLRASGGSDAGRAVARPLSLRAHQKSGCAPAPPGRASRVDTGHGRRPGGKESFRPARRSRASACSAYSKMRSSNQAMRRSSRWRRRSAVCSTSCTCRCCSGGCSTRARISAPRGLSSP